MKYLTVTDIIEFLCAHETAGKDFCEFFGANIWEDNITQVTNTLELHKVLNWIIEHEQLARDLMLYHLISDEIDIDKKTVHEMPFDLLCELLLEACGLT